ncbi:hypothetical protein BpHYR1_039383 [Brachionus plicatilis]|uniref:Uncharacterized protein n=1 Tax=Brachionus plicatilis TaxID=10195 RepID=A0A3M7SUN0_BRAPC|nr:hypothetical protein BpHYR1_039383 [Brachionus plicatilis]
MSRKKQMLSVLKYEILYAKKYNQALKYRIKIFCNINIIILKSLNNITEFSSSLKILVDLNLIFWIKEKNHRLKAILLYLLNYLISDP